MTVMKVRADLIFAAKLLLAVFISAIASLNVLAASNTLNKQDQECLDCHSIKDLDMKLANGETLSLHIDGRAFAKSVHNMIGCAVCHRNTTTDNHPPIKAKIASIRDNSVELSKVCHTCHSGISKLYKGSIHARLHMDGNPIAPICTDCHSPHAVMPSATYSAETGAPCSNCHSPIFDAYTGSVHGQMAFECSSCHRAHDVSAIAESDHLKNACLGCHQDALSSHKTWLPNADRHFDAISCPACHSPGAKRKVDLKLYNNASQQRVTESEGVPQFVTSERDADAKDAGLDAMALKSLLHEFNREGSDSKTILRGRLEVSTGIEAHQLANKSLAIKDCAICHQQGAAPFQSVSVSIVSADGRPLRYDVNKDALVSTISIDSVSGFYVIGGTRIKLLDILLAVTLLGGIGVPIGHLTLTWLFRRYEKKISGKEDS